ncbi:hypothetical protein [Streptomyces sp. NPDC001221]
MTGQPTATAAGDPTSGRPARPERPAGYWERIDRIVSQAPPLSDTQRAIIRAQFHAPAAREAA